MFFPERINVKLTDRVLEVGPGSDPFPLADVFLEKRFKDDRTAYIQSGYAKPRLKRNTVFYPGGRFPFRDKEFDYVVCSHVIEHIAPSDLSGFIGELARVAPRGYIEFPTVFYELVNHEQVHRTYMALHRKQMLFLAKSRFRSNDVHMVLRDMFYAEENARGLLNKYPFLFFEGFEWERTIDFRIVDSFDDLVGVAQRARLSRMIHMHSRKRFYWAAWWLKRKFHKYRLNLLCLVKHVQQNGRETRMGTKPC